MPVRCDHRRLSANSFARSVRIGPSLIGLVGCDDEPAPHHRRVRVRLPDPAGRGHGQHREGPHRPGLLLHREGRDPRPLGRVRAWPASTVWTPATWSPPSRCRPCSAPGCTRWPQQRSAALAGTGRHRGRTTWTRPGWASRSRSTTTTSARSGSRSPAGSSRSTPPRGLPRRTPNSIEDRARIRTEVALEMFRERVRPRPARPARTGRAHRQAVPAEDHRGGRVRPHLLPGEVASRPCGRSPTRRSPRRSNGPTTRPSPTRCAFIETHALFTRTGTNGVRQVDVRGLIGTAFTHRDSRAGDPDLHTHVAVANKVQTVDGRTLALDRRTGAVQGDRRRVRDLQHRPRSSTSPPTLGLRFAERPNPDRRKRPVREIVGVDPALNARWSPAPAEHRGPPTRAGRRVPARPRPSADPGRGDRARPAGHPGDPRSQARTAQPRPSSAPPGATRPSRCSAASRQIAAMIHRALHPDQADRARRWTSAWFDAHRRRDAGPDGDQTGRPGRTGTCAPKPTARSAPPKYPPEHSRRWVDQLVDRPRPPARSPLTRTDRRRSANPTPLRRADGDSVYTVAGAQLFTSQPHPRRRTATRRRRRTPRRHGRRPAPRSTWRCWNPTRTGSGSTPARCCWSAKWPPPGARLQLAIAPAGSGKTTAMDALSRAWTAAGGNVIGLAPSAAAAAQLGDQMQGHHDTLAKLVWDLTPGHGDPPAWETADRAAHPGGHRRGRHGRHPLPRHRRQLHPRAAAAASG